MTPGRSAKEPRPAEAHPAIPLSRVRSGEKCRVVSVDAARQTRLNRLGVYGIVPGAVLRLNQKRPAFVLQVGETILALDREVADKILVVRLP